MADGGTAIDGTCQTTENAVMVCNDGTTLNQDVAEGGLVGGNLADHDGHGALVPDIDIAIVESQVAHLAIRTLQLLDEPDIVLRVLRGGLEMKLLDGASHAVEGTTEILDILRRDGMIGPLWILDVACQPDLLLFNIRILALLGKQPELRGIGDIGPAIYHLGIAFGYFVCQRVGHSRQKR